MPPPSEPTVGNMSDAAASVDGDHPVQQVVAPSRRQGYDQYEALSELDKLDVGLSLIPFRFISPNLFSTSIALWF